VLQIAFNPMQRLEPVYARRCWLETSSSWPGCFFTGGLETRFHSCFWPGSDFGNGAAVRLTIALACWRWPAPRCWCSSICRCRGQR